MNGNDILPFLDPIYRFCYHRLNNRHDAEDLASEIICHVLEGMGKYEIRSLEGWVWRIAHNRYATFINKRNRERSILTDEELYDVEDYCQIEEESIEEQYEELFRSLHTLSADYRDIFVDYYLHDIPIRTLSRKYALPEATVKWRLYEGRQKIKHRIGERNMEKVYARINWNTNVCNGCMDPDKYLHTQLARAICLAAYEKPVTVEEISLLTGIPTLYIEDELPRLEYGDAIEKIGNKYATDFIIYRLSDRALVEKDISELVKRISDRLEEILTGEGMDKLGYILIPYMLRRKIREIKNDRLKLSSGPYPPRKDGGYGWFIVEETVDETETAEEYNSGCNSVGCEDNGRIYYYWICKYMDDIYHNGGIRWMCEEKKLPISVTDDLLPENALTEEEAAHLIAKNLIVKADGCYRLNFARFTEAEFSALTDRLRMEDEEIDELLCDYLLSARKSFKKFVPARLHGQINQYLNGWSHRLIGRVIDELILRGVLERPDHEKPLVNGVFYVQGGNINP